VASGESATPPEVPDDCAGPDLSNLPKARKALAAAARLIKAGRIPSDRAGSYVNALTALVKAYQDARDSLWTKRAEQLWKEREARQSAEPASNH
jgi:hypothetical protein